MPGLGELFKAARLRAGLSQGALARRAQIDPAVLSNIERGKRAGLRFDTVARLAMELGLSLDSLAQEMGYGFDEGQAEKAHARHADLAEALEKAHLAQRETAEQLGRARKIVGSLRVRRKKTRRCS